MLAIHLVWVWFGHIAAAIVGSWALWRGGSTERYGAALIWFTWILTPLVQSPGDVDIDVGIATVDTLTFAGFMWLSLKSRALWTAFASAFMLLTVAGHFAPGIGGGITLFSYITNNGFWGGYALLSTLFVAMIVRERRLRHAHALSSS